MASEVKTQPFVHLFEYIEIPWHKALTELKWESSWFSISFITEQEDEKVTCSQKRFDATVYIGKFHSLLDLEHEEEGVP